MTIQDLKNLDLYKCSLKDINKAENALSNTLKKIINSGKVYSEKFKEYKKLHVLISKARMGVNPNGEMIGYNTNIDRLPNSKSIL